VRGVTSLQEELFVPYCRNDGEVEVYSKSDFVFLHRFTVPGLSQRGEHDMIACAEHRCVYIADSDVHRIDEKNLSVSKQELHCKPCGLSVVRHRRGSVDTVRLLVACRLSGTGILVELNAQGQCTREVVLESSLSSLWHAVQLKTGNYVISCRGYWCARGEKIGIADRQGKVKQSYGDWWVPCGRKLLRGACHIAVDSDGFVFCRR